MAPVQLQYPLGHIVEEIAIVRDCHHRARVFLQVALEPCDRLRIEMVGRLIEKKQLGTLQQDLAQGYAPAFPAGERGRGGIPRRKAHRVHGDFQVAIEFPRVGRLDGVLGLPEVFQDLFHLVGFEGFAQLGAQFFIAMQQGPS